MAIAAPYKELHFDIVRLKVNENEKEQRLYIIFQVDSLGAGSFATVKKVRYVNGKNSCIAAAKIFDRMALNNKEIEKEFLKEVKIYLFSFKNLSLFELSLRLHN